MQKPRILIVEDSLSNQLFLKDLLEPDYSLKMAGSGEDGVKAVETFLPDIILLDIVLPGIDGYETCRIMRQDPRLFRTKILFLSSQSKPDERLNGYTAGADDYITKPVNGEELQAKIRVYLRLKSAEEVTQQLDTAYRQTIRSLVLAMEAKDEYTSGHSQRVGFFARKLGEFLGLSPYNLQLLEWAGYVHDIGKIGIPDSILTKKGKLTTEEMDIIKTHPLKSFKVLEPVEAMKELLNPVKYHHEHYDGSGYPEGLKGEETPLLARIMQIADIWDALTTRRPYRGAMTVDEARKVMTQEAGKTVDPRLLTRFFALLEAEPLLFDSVMSHG